MFTGIVQSVGAVRELRLRGRNATLDVEGRLPGEALSPGESICVDGCCLTVSAGAEDGFVADLSAETLEVTVLADLRTGSRVNLERALRPMDRLGGHLVQGHVDAVGRVVQLRPAGEGYHLEVSHPPELNRYIVHKGSIAVNGISLTVASRAPGRFRCALVPHTVSGTTLDEWRTGRRVNLEVDVLARYVESLIGPDSEDRRWRSLLGGGPSPSDLV